MGCGGSKDKGGKGKSLKELLNDPEELKKIYENAKKQFDEADADKSGQLDYKEFDKSCNSYNRKFNFPVPTPEQVQQALVQFDTDKNGKLNLEEYTKMIMAVLTVLADMEKDKPKSS
mmetsp:Transcript_11124/g.12732  ORF Transcript_11124/g.12732 Transcript_11124/m.12732 type:complete len:117 (-) Transcript_11124:208-558(-)